MSTTTAEPTCPELQRVQNWMLAAITHPGGAREGTDSTEARSHLAVGSEGIESVVTRSTKLTALERLEVYGSAYHARLLDCLREEFPVLKHALGADTFDAFAAGYLQQYPPRSYTLFELARDFPQFLRETRPALESDTAPVDWADFLIDLAALERTFNEVFDGPGVEGQELLDVERLRAVPADHLAEARFVPVPCLRLLTLRYPVQSYFTEVRNGGDPAPPEPADTHLAVTRRRYVVRHRELAPAALELLGALIAGEPLGAGIERALATARSDATELESNLQNWFHDWAAEGFFLSVEVPS
jgi:hypothetical protein